MKRGNQMYRLLSFSFLFLLLASADAQEQDLVVLGKVNFQEERIGTEIEQRFLVKIMEQYLGEPYILPLVDMRLFKDINHQLVEFSSEDKALFITKKQKDGSYKIQEYIKYPVNYLFPVDLDKAYKFIFTQKLENTIQEQIDKHKSLADGSFEFMHIETGKGHQLAYYNVAMPVYHFSAVRSYLQKEIEEFSQYFKFEKQQQYKVVISDGRAFVNLQKFRTRIEQFPKL